ncbi:universal stress protein [Roseiarcaceae bacterium H3SJ34-1]|uniref:universal stress protein n=1 Tax=Terripilifer ovatus TaxID=3032367 RepID=UPI003AB9B36D|nr:universal stress protein [Roseiarcaceae bacterium H3SJ34-1]
MSCQDILCVFEPTQAGLPPAFAQAVALAKAQQAHLTVVPVSVISRAPGSAISAALVSGMLKTVNDQVRAATNVSAQAAKEALALSGLTYDVNVHEGIMLDLGDWIAKAARSVDLTVVDRPSNAIEASELFFERALFSSGRPVLVASPEHMSEAVRKATLAWNGSAVAARALGEAIALFPSLKAVDVVVVNGEKSLANALPGTEIAQHLARHKIEVNLIEAPVVSGSIAATIDEVATRAKSDLIVMGGFGHSRLREFLLGGVTAEITALARLPVLFAH